MSRAISLHPLCLHGIHRDKFAFFFSTCGNVVLMWVTCVLQTSQENGHSSADTLHANVTVGDRYLKAQTTQIIFPKIQFLRTWCHVVQRNIHVFQRFLLPSSQGFTRVGKLIGEIVKSNAWKVATVPHLCIKIKLTNKLTKQLHGAGSIWEAHGSTASQKIPHFYETNRFITEFIRGQISLSWARSI